MSNKTFDISVHGGEWAVIDKKEAISNLKFAFNKRANRAYLEVLKGAEVCLPFGKIRLTRSAAEAAAIDAGVYPIQLPKLHIATPARIAQLCKNADIIAGGL